MSEKKEKITTEATKKDKNAPAKKKSVDFKAIGAKVKKFFKDFKGEWKKVTWPSRKTVINHSLVVIAVVAVVGVVLFAMDTGLSAIIDGLVSLANKQDVAESAKDAAQMISLFLMK